MNEEELARKKYLELDLLVLKKENHLLELEAKRLQRIVGLLFSLLMGTWIALVVWCFN